MVREDAGPGFIGSLLHGLESSQSFVAAALEGLSDDDLYRQPEPWSNSIAWMAWHLSRWQDLQSAQAAQEREIWSSEEWYSRFGVDEARSGLGDTPEQVGDFRPDRGLLIAYRNAAYAAANGRILGLEAERLTEEVEYMSGMSRPVWRALATMLIDTTQHTGQILYLRGMYTGPRWFPA